MATVTELATLQQSYENCIKPLREQEMSIVRVANANGQPQWTDELRQQIAVVRATIKPLNERWNRLLRLREAREFVLHAKYDRLELAGELGINQTYIAGDRNWPADGDLDAANAATLAKYGLPATFAECEVEGDVNSPVARYLEARDLDVQAELDSLQVVN